VVVGGLVVVVGAAVAEVVDGATEVVVSEVVEGARVLVTASVVGGAAVTVLVLSPTTASSPPS